MKVLFITYWFDNPALVGSHRMTYWAKHLSEMRPEITSTVITANLPRRDGFPGIIHLPNERSSAWRLLLKDEGVTWRLGLKEFLEGKGRDLTFDYVIMSGGPFMHFSLAQAMKDIWKAKIVMDFRDPFSGNSRFGKQPFKNAVKRFFERRFVGLADHIITVNEFCAGLLPPPAQAKLTIIDNGYDETILEHRRTIDMEPNRVHLAYAGSFMDDKDPTVFLSALSQPELRNRIRFHHIGKPSRFLDPFLSEPFLVRHGVQDYRTTIDIINSCTAGILFTSGAEFESLTKIFDYIGCNKPILVITRGEPKTGNIYKITESLPGVMWLRHQREEIGSFLASYEPLPSIPYDTHRYTRRYGLQKLSALLQ